MEFNDIFPNVYVINLPKDTTRWNKVSSELSNNGINNFTKFPAITVNNGNTIKDREEGCKQSHINIIKTAKNKNLEWICILEDDIEIREDYKNYLVSIHKFITKFPWHIFYLGCNYRCPTISFGISNIVKIPMAYTTHAYVVNKSIYDTIVNIQNTPQNLEPKNQIDCLYSRIIQPQGHCFGIHPRLISQSTGFSNIQNKFVDYRVLRDE